MSVLQVVLIVWFMLAAISTILLIGKERTVISPGYAAACVAIYAVMSFAVAYFGGC